MCIFVLDSSYGFLGISLEIVYGTNFFCIKFNMWKSLESLGIFIIYFIKPLTLW